MIPFFYVADTANNRIVKRSLSDLSYVAKVGTVGTGNDQFDNPMGVTSDDTYLYVVDSYNHRIVKRMLSDMSYVAKIGTQGAGNNNFYQPFGATNDGTYLYVSDTYNNRIVKRLLSDLSYVSKIGTQGSGNDNFYLPRGITNDGTYLYVFDTLNNRIVKRLLSNLSYVSQIGSFGAGNDQFNYSYGITNDGAYLYVVDTYNHRIVKRLLSSLAYVSKIGTQGSGNNNFENPFGATSDGTWLYVADSGNNRIVKRLLSDLSYVTKVGTVGTGNDQFNSCYGVAVGAEAQVVLGSSAITGGGSIVIVEAKGALGSPAISGGGSVVAVSRIVRSITVRSYWKRFMSRNPNYKGRLMEIYEGQVGMAESEFTRTWVGKLTNVTTQRGEFTFESRDLLKDLSSIDDPPKLDIKLAADLSNVESGQITLTSVEGLGSGSGYIRIKDEIIGYATLNVTTKAIQTLTRGAFGTVADEYKARDKVQAVRYYAPANPWDILLEMLRVDAGIADADIDLDAFALAKRTPGNDKLFRAVLSEPESLDKLFFEITDILDAKAWVG